MSKLVFYKKIHFSCNLNNKFVSEFHKKKVLSINEENDTIEYNQTKLFYFNQRDSGARSDEDVVTIINTGLLVNFIVL